MPEFQPLILVYGSHILSEIELKLLMMIVQEFTTGFSRTMITINFKSMNLRLQNNFIICLKQSTDDYRFVIMNSRRSVQLNCV